MFDFVNKELLVADNDFNLILAFYSHVDKGIVIVAIPLIVNGKKFILIRIAILAVGAEFPNRITRSLLAIVIIFALQVL